MLDLGRGPDQARVRKWHSGYRTKRLGEAARVELVAGLKRADYVKPSKLAVRCWRCGGAASTSPPADRREKTAAGRRAVAVDPGTVAALVLGDDG